MLLDSPLVVGKKNDFGCDIAQQCNISITNVKLGGKTLESHITNVDNIKIVNVRLDHMGKLVNTSI